MSDAPTGATAPAPSPMIAAGFMVAAAAIIAVTTLIAKSLGTATLGPPMHPLQVTFGRYLFGAASIAVVALWLRPNIKWGLWHLHGVRVAFGWAGVTCMFAAVASIPLAEATAISFLNPIVAMVLAVLFLREHVGPWRWIAASIALAGAVVLLRPGSGAIAPGALLAVGAAFLLGAEIMMIKRLTRLDSPLAILCWSNGLGAIISAAVVWSIWAAPSPAQWAAMVTLGVAMASAQGCFVQAMARGEASFVTPFSYLTLVFAAAYDLALFGVLPDGAGWVGAALILSGAILLAWRESRLRA